MYWWRRVSKDLLIQSFERIMQKNTKNDSVKISKKSIYSAVIVILLLVFIGFFAFRYYPNMIKEKKINEYKKALYEGAICQYDCPLVEQVFQNKTQLLPEVTCIKTCLGDFVARNLTLKDFTNQDLQKDDFMKDVEKSVTNCKTKVVDITIEAERNREFFGCISLGLKTLKSKYNYLN